MCMCTVSDTHVLTYVPMYIGVYGCMLCFSNICEILSIQ